MRKTAIPVAASMPEMTVVPRMRRPPGREALVRIDRGALRLFHVRLDGALGEGRSQIPTAGGDLADGAHQLGCARVFQDVGGGAVAERLDHISVAGVHGENHDPRLRGSTRDLSGHLEPPQARHHQVEHQHGRTQALDQAGHLEAVGSLAHDREAGLLLQERAQTLPDDGVVIGQHDGRGGHG